MKSIVVLLFTIVPWIVPGNLQGQTDSLKTGKGIPVNAYLGIGGGSITGGGNVDISLTTTSKGGMGGSLHYMPGFIYLKNVPEDYYEGFLRTSTPIHTFQVLSVNFVKKFSNKKGTFRFGLEAGPSWGWFDMVSLKLNPDYPGLMEYKYDKIRTKKNDFGFSSAIRADFPFTRFLGCDISLFTNLNSIQSFFGIDFSLILGMVRAEKYKF